MQIIDMTDISLHVNNPYKPGHYICIVFFKTTLKNVARSKIVYKGVFERSKDHSLVFRIVYINSIYSNCFAIPDSSNQDTKELLECDEWLFVESRNYWSKHIES